MSSYYQSFSCMTPNGIRYNSFLDKNLIVVHFESGDSGEVNTFLDMEPVYQDNAYGTRRFDYGARYSEVAVIRISVMKADGTDFTVAEVRDFLRWTTGSRRISYLDLSDIVETDSGKEEIVRFSFLGRISAVYQQKLDARTVGFVIEHTSISPWAYSGVYEFSHNFNRVLRLDYGGIIVKDSPPLSITDDGILCDITNDFIVTDDKTMNVDNSVNITVYNDTDDLSSYVYLDTIFASNHCDSLIITNKTLYEESNGADGATKITGIQSGETVQLTSEQFITSSFDRAMGRSFNFVWPKLLPGENEIAISCSGDGTIYFRYRHPVKIGDCAMNVDVSSGGLCCDGYSGGGDISGQVTWNDIIGKPSTRSGYNITDVYTMTEVDDKINNAEMSIDEDELNAMLEDVLQ